MTLDNISRLIATQIEQYGNDCTIEKQNGEAITTRVIARQLWRKDKTRFEGVITELGEAIKEYSICIFPSSVIVDDMHKNDIIHIGDIDYYFIKGDGIYSGDKPLYSTCVVRQIIKEEEYVFE